ncbi:unnamed protein product [Spirodela intermedia]|uniref:CID domain-containing protein n=1 Tax=Spirodela intermedia TaxID=51605 RepID=A0A7I8I910_SPIIN|nr:unnamed protein product [Spirodela intermedia]CAA6654129.1 unnamed protein product [Spirodela intermedia]
MTRRICSSYMGHIWVMRESLTREKHMMVLHYEPAAFCNHADVEAFTEEKKKSLLVKRQGKGADFVRAVDEISEKFERLTKHMINDVLCSGDEGVESHAENVEGLGVNSWMKDLKKESLVSSNGPSETICSLRIDDSHGSEEQNDQISIVDHLRNATLTSNASLRRRSRDTSHSSDIQKRALSHQSSYSVSDESTDDFSLNDNIVKKSPDVHDTSSEVSTLVGNNGNDDIEFGPTVVESGTYSSNELCIVESNRKAESKIDNLEKGLELNGGFDTERTIIVLKKKRKPNKKRFDQEAAISTKQEEAAFVHSERNTCPVSFDCCHSLNERRLQTDGDEHLPLVKRARVRMGNVSEEQKSDELVGIVVKSEKDMASFDHNLSSSSDGSCATNETSRKDGSLPTDDQMQATEHGNTMDVEAALPPSKRLHRALEAMSANAAEANNGCLEASTLISVSSSGSAQFCNVGTHHILFDVNSDGRRKLHGTLLPDVKEMPNRVSGYSSSTFQVVNGSPRSSADEKCGAMSLENSMTQPMDCELSDKTVITELHDKSPHPCFVESGDKVSAASGHDALRPLSSLVRGESTNVQLQLCKPQSGTATTVSNHVDNVSVDDSVDKSLTSNCAAVFVSAVDMKPPSSFSDEKDGGDIQELTVGVKHMLTPKEPRVSPDSTSMKNLIAAAPAKRPHSQSGYLPESKYFKPVPDGSSRPTTIYYENSSHKLSPIKSTVNHTRIFLEETACSLHSGGISPDPNQQCHKPTDCAPNQNEKTLNKSMTHAEASAARKSFESLVSTLSRTKESIGRATRVAIDCVKYGIAGEVVQILLQNLERTVNLSRKLDLFFLVDSITQCSRVQKGAAGDSYPSLFQSVLPRLLFAAAPPGNTACDNRRQCLKVLRLWHERKILPESIVRHHIRELESTSGASFSSVSSRFPPRAERALNDPIREMEGMLVDEYGSNASFQIPVLVGSHLMDEEEEGSADDEKSFETVTPEHDTETCKEVEASLNSFPDKHTRILEDVDGGISSTYETRRAPTGHATHYQPDKHVSLGFAPPLPADNPPSPPPLPSSPPPVVPPCPPMLPIVPPPLPAAPCNHGDGLDSHRYAGRNSMQYPLSNHRSCGSSMNLRASNRGDCYAPGCIDYPKQMQLSSSSCNYQSSYGYHSGSHSSHLKPILHDHTEKDRAQTWRDHSSPFDRRVQYANEAQGGHFYGDGCARRPVQSEVSDRCRFSSAARSGMIVFSTSFFLTVLIPNLLAYHGPPAEVSSVSSGWSNPPRASSYRYSIAAARPPVENKISRVAGGTFTWLLETKITEIPWKVCSFLILMSFGKAEEKGSPHRKSCIIAQGYALYEFSCFNTSFYFEILQDTVPIVILFYFTISNDAWADILDAS